MAEPVTSSIMIHRILTDPAAAHWLKHAIETAVQRDVVDAANDAEVLAKVLRLRCDEALGKKSGNSMSVIEVLEVIARGNTDPDIMVELAAAALVKLKGGD